MRCCLAAMCCPCWSMAMHSKSSGSKPPPICICGWAVRALPVDLRDPRSLRARQGGAQDEKGPRKIVAPMPGRVVRLLVAEQAEVEAGQGIVVVEAMKMQNEIKSPKKGIVKKIVAREARP